MGFISAAKARELATTENGIKLTEDFKKIEEKITEAATSGKFGCVYVCKARSYGEIITTLITAGYHVVDINGNLTIEW